MNVRRKYLALEADATAAAAAADESSRQALKPIKVKTRSLDSAVPARVFYLIQRTEIFTLEATIPFWSVKHQGD